MTKALQLGGTAEALRQLIEGNDFEPPARMLGDLMSEEATTVPPGCPYSIAAVLAHTLFWQNRWLGRIREEPLVRKRGKRGDWPPVSPQQWDTVRAAFLKGLEEALAMASTPGELDRKLWNGDTVDSQLLMVVEHGAYHLGQIALLRQLIGAWPPQDMQDS